MIKRKINIVRFTIYLCTILFVLINLISIFHSYKFTHFTETQSERTNDPNKLSVMDKFKVLVFGVNNPRPKNTISPPQEFKTIMLQSNKNIECWHIEVEASKGTVILFHGYGGFKSGLISKSNEFIKLGYSTLLVDFMGSGGSEGNQTTIGYYEAEQVKACFDYLVNQGENNIYLFGSSMGAVAIMKAIYDFELTPKGIIIECPFGSMYKTVCARFKTMKVPTFPLAHTILFWGGVQNSFWAYGHNPTKYAKKITCPVLLLYGEEDEKVSREEIDTIFENLSGEKTLKIYKNTGHENYLLKNKNEWKTDISDFLHRFSVRE